jgi:hypothetical protein
MQGVILETKHETASGRGVWSRRGDHRPRRRSGARPRQRTLFLRKRGIAQRAKHREEQARDNKTQYGALER